MIASWLEFNERGYQELAWNCDNEMVGCMWQVEIAEKKLPGMKFGKQMYKNDHQRGVCVFSTVNLEHDSQ